MKAKHIGRVKIRRSSGYVKDEDETSYEITNLDNLKLRSSDYFPFYCSNIRIKKKNQPIVVIEDHYFIYKNNLFYSAAKLDKNERIALCELIRKEQEDKGQKNAEMNLLQVYPECFTEEQDGINNANKDLNQMSGLEFEKLISSLLIKIGFDVTVTKQTADGGIDLVAYNIQPLLEGTYIVQCKRWGSSIGEPIVRDLYGVVTAERANKGILITNSNYTNSAISFAQGKPIELIDGLKLIKLLENNDLLPNKYIPDGVDSSSNSSEDTTLKEELSTLLNIVRKDPTNLRLRIKLACKQIDSVWYGMFSKDVTLKMIRDAEDNLDYLSNMNYKVNDKVTNFIRHMSFHQLGYLKVVRGNIADGIKYFLKAIEIKSFLKASLNDPNYRLDEFIIKNIINIITLSNFIGAGRLTQKISSKYGLVIDNFINDLCMREYIIINPNFNFLRENWRNRAIYVLNYDKHNHDLEEILVEYGSDDYRFDDELHDLAHMFDKFNKNGIFSISDEEKIYQKTIVGAICLCY